MKLSDLLPELTADKTELKKVKVSLASAGLEKRNTLTNLKFANPYQSTVKFPRAPVYSAEDDSIPSFSVAAALLPVTLENLPPAVREIVHNEKIKVEDCSVYFVVQNAPWKVDTEVVYIPQTVLDSDALETAHQYNISFTVDTAAFGINSKPELLRYHDKVKVRQETNKKVVYSYDDLMAVKGIKDRSQSHCFYTLCLETSVDGQIKLFLTLNFILNKTDFQATQAIVDKSAENSTVERFLDAVEDNPQLEHLYAGKENNFSPVNAVDCLMGRGTYPESDAVSPYFIGKIEIPVIKPRKQTSPAKAASKEVTYATIPVLLAEDQATQFSIQYFDKPKRIQTQTGIIGKEIRTGHNRHNGFDALATVAEPYFNGQTFAKFLIRKIRSKVPAWKCAEDKRNNLRYLISTYCAEVLAADPNYNALLAAEVYNFANDCHHQTRSKIPLYNDYLYRRLGILEFDRAAILDSFEETSKTDNTLDKEKITQIMLKDPAIMRKYYAALASDTDSVGLHFSRSSLVSVLKSLGLPYVLFEVNHDTHGKPVHLKMNDSRRVNGKDDPLQAIFFNEADFGIIELSAAEDFFALQTPEDLVEEAIGEDIEEEEEAADLLEIEQNPKWQFSPLLWYGSDIAEEYTTVNVQSAEADKQSARVLLLAARIRQLHKEVRGVFDSPTVEDWFDKTDDAITSPFNFTTDLQQLNAMQLPADSIDAVWIQQLLLDDDLLDGTSLAEKINARLTNLDSDEKHEQVAADLNQTVEMLHRVILLLRLRALIATRPVPDIIRQNLNGVLSADNENPMAFSNERIKNLIINQWNLPDADLIKAVKELGDGAEFARLSSTLVIVIRYLQSWQKVNILIDDNAEAIANIIKPDKHADLEKSLSNTRHIELAKVMAERIHNLHKDMSYTIGLTTPNQSLTALHIPDNLTNYRVETVQKYRQLFSAMDDIWQNEKTLSPRHPEANALKKLIVKDPLSLVEAVKSGELAGAGFVVAEFGLPDLVGFNFAAAIANKERELARRLEELIKLHIQVHTAPARLLQVYIDKPAIFPPNEQINEFVLQPDDGENPLEDRLLPSELAAMTDDEFDKTINIHRCHYKAHDRIAELSEIAEEYATLNLNFSVGDTNEIKKEKNNFVRNKILGHLALQQNAASLFSVVVLADSDEPVDPFDFNPYMCVFVLDHQTDVDFARAQELFTTIANDFTEEKLHTARHGEVYAEDSLAAVLTAIRLHKINLFIRQLVCLTAEDRQQVHGALSKNGQALLGLASDRSPVGEDHPSYLAYSTLEDRPLVMSKVSAVAQLQKEQFGKYVVRSVQTKLTMALDKEATRRIEKIVNPAIAALRALDASDNADAVHQQIITAILLDNPGDENLHRLLDIITMFYKQRHGALLNPNDINDRDAMLYIVQHTDQEENLANNPREPVPPQVFQYVDLAQTITNNSRVAKERIAIANEILKFHNDRLPNDDLRTILHDRVLAAIPASEAGNLQAHLYRHVIDYIRVKLKEMKAERLELNPEDAAHRRLVLEAIEGYNHTLLTAIYKDDVLQPLMETIKYQEAARRIELVNPLLHAFKQYSNDAALPQFTAILAGLIPARNPELTSLYHFIRDDARPAKLEPENAQHRASVMQEHLNPLMTPALAEQLNLAIKKALRLQDLYKLYDQLHQPPERALQFYNANRALHCPPNEHINGFILLTADDENPLDRRPLVDGLANLSDIEFAEAINTTRYYIEADERFSMWNVIAEAYEPLNPKLLNGAHDEEKYAVDRQAILSDLDENNPASRLFDESVNAEGPCTQWEISNSTRLYLIKPEVFGDKDTLLAENAKTFTELALQESRATNIYTEDALAAILTAIRIKIVNQLIRQGFCLGEKGVNTLVLGLIGNADKAAGILLNIAKNAIPGDEPSYLKYSVVADREAVLHPNEALAEIQTKQFATTSVAAVQDVLTSALDVEARRRIDILNDITQALNNFGEGEDADRAREQIIEDTLLVLPTAQRLLAIAVKFRAHEALDVENAVHRDSVLYIEERAGAGRQPVSHQVFQYADLAQTLTRRMAADRITIANEILRFHHFRVSDNDAHVDLHGSVLAYLPDENDPKRALYRHVIEYIRPALIRLLENPLDPVVLDAHNADHCQLILGATPGYTQTQLTAIYKDTVVRPLMPIIQQREAARRIALVNKPLTAFKAHLVGNFAVILADQIRRINNDSLNTLYVFVCTDANPATFDPENPLHCDRVMQEILDTVITKARTKTLSSVIENTHRLKELRGLHAQVHTPPARVLQEYTSNPAILPPVVAINGFVIPPDTALDRVADRVLPPELALDVMNDDTFNAAVNTHRYYYDADKRIAMLNAIIREGQTLFPVLPGDMDDDEKGEKNNIVRDGLLEHLAGDAVDLFDQAIGEDTSDATSPWSFSNGMRFFAIGHILRNNVDGQQAQALADKARDFTAADLHNAPDRNTYTEANLASILAVMRIQKFNRLILRPLVCLGNATVRGIVGALADGNQVDLLTIANAYNLDVGPQYLDYAQDKIDWVMPADAADAQRQETRFATANIRAIQATLAPELAREASRRIVDIINPVIERLNAIGNDANANFKRRVILRTILANNPGVRELLNIIVRLYNDHNKTAFDENDVDDRDSVLYIVDDLDEPEDLEDNPREPVSPDVFQDLNLVRLIDDADWDYDIEANRARDRILIANHILRFDHYRTIDDESRLELRRLVKSQLERLDIFEEDAEGEAEENLYRHVIDHIRPELIRRGVIPLLLDPNDHAHYSLVLDAVPDVYTQAQLMDMYSDIVLAPVMETVEQQETVRRVALVNPLIADFLLHNANAQLLNFADILNGLVANVGDANLAQLHQLISTTAAQLNAFHGPNGVLVMDQQLDRAMTPTMVVYLQDLIENARRLSVVQQLQLYRRNHMPASVLTHLPENAANARAEEVNLYHAVRLGNDDIDDLPVVLAVDYQRVLNNARQTQNNRTNDIKTFDLNKNCVEVRFYHAEVFDLADQVQDLIMDIDTVVPEAVLDIFVQCQEHLGQALTDLNAIVVNHINGRVTNFTPKTEQIGRLRAELLRIEEALLAIRFGLRAGNHVIGGVMKLPDELNNTLCTKADVAARINALILDPAKRSQALTLLDYYGSAAAAGGAPGSKMVPIEEAREYFRRIDNDIRTVPGNIALEPAVRVRGTIPAALLAAFQIQHMLELGQAFLAAAVEHPEQPVLTTLDGAIHNANALAEAGAPPLRESAVQEEYRTWLFYQTKEFIGRDNPNHRVEFKQPDDLLTVVDELQHEPALMTTFSGGLNNVAATLILCSSPGFVKMKMNNVPGGLFADLPGGRSLRNVQVRVNGAVRILNFVDGPHPCSSMQDGLKLLIRDMQENPHAQPSGAEQIRIIQQVFLHVIDNLLSRVPNNFVYDQTVRESATIVKYIDNIWQTLDLLLLLHKTNETLRLGVNTSGHPDGDGPSFFSRFNIAETSANVAAGNFSAKNMLGMPVVGHAAAIPGIIGDQAFIDKLRHEDGRLRVDPHLHFMNGRGYNKNTLDNVCNAARNAVGPPAGQRFAFTGF